MSIVAKRLDGMDASRPRPRPHSVRRGPSSPPRKGHSLPLPLFGPSLLWARSPISAAELVIFTSFTSASVWCEVLKYDIIHRIFKQKIFSSSVIYFVLVWCYVFCTQSSQNNSHTIQHSLLRNTRVHLLTQLVHTHTQTHTHISIKERKGRVFI